MDNTEMEKELKQLEKDELDMLIGRGANFIVVYKMKEHPKGFLGRLRKKKWVEKRDTFEIKQPTLAILNRISSESLHLELDEVELSKGDMSTLISAREAVEKNASRMAKIVAIAVIGEDYYDHSTKRYDKGYEGAINRYTEFFLHSIKPTQLVRIVSTITNISNIADFISSTRLMSTVARTTQSQVE